MLLKRNSIRIPFILLLFLGIAFGASYCGSEATKKTIADSTPKFLYLNHDTAVHYVGMQTCRKCHENIYATFIHTGMGQSFDRATPHKSKGKFGTAALIHDDSNNM